MRRVKDNLRKAERVHQPLGRKPRQRGKQQRTPTTRRDGREGSRGEMEGGGTAST